MLPIAGACLLLIFAQNAQDSCAAAAGAYAEGDLDGAAGYLERCIEAHPSDLAWYLRLCAVYQSLGRDDDLFRVATLGMERFPAEQRFYLSAGIRAARSGDMESAVRIFTAAFERWPGDPAIRGDLSQALLLRGTSRLDGGDNVGAEADLRRVTELEPAHCDALMNLGRALYNLLRSGESLETFDRVLALRPDYPGVELHRGIVLATMGRSEAAIEALDRHLATSDDPEGRYFRGLAWKGRGDWERALVDFEKAAFPGSRNGDAFYEKGGCLENLSRISEAEVAYRRAAELDSSQPKYKLALGQLLIRGGRREEGQSILEEARKSYTGMVRQDQQRLVFKSVPGDPPGDGGP
jgi:tetratricopeptide (TPR) repeat protein